MKKITLILLVVLMSVILRAEVRIVPLHVGQEKFLVEIADTFEKQITGLMFRKSIASDFGMLFVYDNEQPRSIWMKNTLIPLDIIYLDRDKQVIDMYQNAPPCVADPCESYPSRKPAQYVLEIKAGRAEQIDLKLGDRMFFLIELP